METGNTNEPIAAALTPLVLTLAASQTADQLMLETILIRLCQAFPPLIPGLQETFADLASIPRSWEPGQEEAFLNHTAAYQAKLQAMQQAFGRG
jgi:hypothetical protein